MGPRRIRRGKPLQRLSDELDGTVASMGPRRIRRGKPSKKKAATEGSYPASMGPRRIGGGKQSGNRANKTIAQGRLQWGHGESAVENRHVRRIVRVALGASMGPRRIRRGKLGSSADLPPRWNGFN